ncbi:DNA ligase 1-like [Nasonia vitripennis]|uniref:Uncharacterized protein n=1 Tax=Nasonia vitripennis TaxID=7425 RepID=A0A7M7H9R9_NASVI|nr:DNA ligase 1-like [Nasonia vitripennis]
MNELEDEPDDVQKATPVEDELKRAEIDKLSTRTMAVPKEETQPRHRCQKEPAIQKIDCCEAKRQRQLESRRQKIVTMYVHEEPCKLVKQEIIPRHCMSKEEYIDFLAKPSEKCPSPCAKKPVKRRVRAMSPRIDELAKPTVRRLRNTLEDRADVLSARMVDNLVEVLEGETALTAEQAENFVRDLRASKKSSKPKKRKTKCRSSPKPPQPIFEGGDPIDPEVADHQYSIAKRFVRSILNFKCPIPREDYQDISETVLEMLSEQLEYTPVGNEDRKSRQMRILADSFACWLSGILLRVSEKHKEELEEECLKKRREMEELAAREAMMRDDADDEDEGDDDLDEDRSEDDDDDDDEEKLLSKAESLARSLAQSEADEEGEGEEDEGDDSKTYKSDGVSIAVEDSTTQYEEADIEGVVMQEPDEDLVTAASLKAQSEVRTMAFRTDLTSEAEEDALTQAMSEAEMTALDEEEQSLLLLEEGVDEQQQTEPEVKFDAETETTAELRTLRSEVSAAKSREQRELERIASKMSKAFETDVPFLTFGKLADTLYTMLEAHSENKLSDPIDNRLHRAIYEKLSEAILREDPSLLTDRTRDVVDVVSGKITSWLRKTLDEQQIKFLDEEAPAKIESREVREWSEWLENLTDQADIWSKWIEKVTGEAKLMKTKGKVTRGAWQDWTSKFDSNALRWRETYLKARHQEHWNTMMMAERKVLKTGTKSRPAALQEKTIKNTNFESPSRA